MREALARLWYLRDAMTNTHGQHRARLGQLVVTEQVVCQRLCLEWHQPYEHVDQIETFRKIVLNPLSHANTTTVTRVEIQGAIDAVHALNSGLN